MTDDQASRISWLLAGDPAVAWQVQRDLLHAPPAEIDSTRARVAQEGWGARLLGLRDDDGSWGGGLYSPKWVSTFYSMRLLYWFGLDGTHPAAVESCALLLDRGFLPDGGITLWSVAYSDCCVTAMMLALAVRFGHARDERVDAIADRLLADQLDDGGWNCRADQGGCRVSSFHTTLSALEALNDYAGTDAARGARVFTAAALGYAYFLRHHLFRSERTGQIVKTGFTRFSFPPRWYFDVLRALDCFRASRFAWDPRLEEAVALVGQRQGADGRWKNQNWHTGREHFKIEAAGTPSRWNTLRALRVLNWADDR